MAARARSTQFDAKYEELDRLNECLLLLCEIWLDMLVACNEKSSNFHECTRISGRVRANMYIWKWFSWRCRWVPRRTKQLELVVSVCLCTCVCVLEPSVCLARNGVKGIDSILFACSGRR